MIQLTKITHEVIFRKNFSLSVTEALCEYLKKAS